MRLRLEALRSLVVALLGEIDGLWPGAPGDISGGICISAEIRRYEAELIRRAMYTAGGNQRRAAQLLGMKVTTLHSKIKRHGIRAEPAA